MMAMSCPLEVDAMSCWRSGVASCYGDDIINDDKKGLAWSNENGANNLNLASDQAASDPRLTLIFVGCLRQLGWLSL